MPQTKRADPLHLAPPQQPQPQPRRKPTMAQPATAAAVIAAIFASLLVAFLSYKLYVRVHHRRMQREQELPPIREPVSMYGNTLVSSGNSQAGTLYGTTEWPDGWKGSASRASLNTASHLNGFHPDSRRPSVVGYLQSPQVAAADMSAPSSPLSPGIDADLPTPPGEAYDHLRGVSSTSSTMTLKRSYAASSLRGSGAQSPILSTRPRDSYLPHLPSNRESIHIVTPQPLGFGVGGMAQATDQRTLAFSKASGIGSTDDEFSTGLDWAAEGDGSGGVNEFGAASGSRFGEEERTRYLAEGPNRTWSSLSRNGRGAGSSPAASDVIMPGDSVSRSRSPASKSRTPSPANKGRGKAEEGGASAGHPLEVTATDVRLGPGSGPSFIAQQSPLQMMSQRMEAGAPAPLPKDRLPGPSATADARHRDHHRVVSDADTLATAMSYGENGGRGSPILSGGFAAGAQHTPDRYPSDLPALDSSGGDSHSTPTGPSTATDSSTGRPSASASDRDADGTTATNTPVVPSQDDADPPSSPYGGRSFALGADGLLRMVGQAVKGSEGSKDIEAGQDAANKGRRSSWLPSIIGGSA